MIEYMVDSGKTYEGEITLGFATTTEDVSGEIVEKQLQHLCQLNKLIKQWPK